ncbi:hypothetical protein D3C87_2042820 [compost metagenome]
MIRSTSKDKAKPAGIIPALFCQPGLSATILQISLTGVEVSDVTASLGFLPMIASLLPNNAVDLFLIFLANFGE